MRLTRLFFFLFFLIHDSQASGLRIIVPDVSELDNFNKKEGELAVENGKLKIYSENRFQEVSQFEHLPDAYKSGTSEITVKAGSLYIGEKFFSNDSEITCTHNFSTAKTGYLYLMEGEEGGFICVISDSPTNPGVTGKWRRMFSFYSSASFWTKNGTVHYTEGFTKSFSASSPSSCTPLPLDNRSPTSQRLYFKLLCNVVSNTSYTIHLDSACTTARQLYTCNFMSFFYFQVSPTITQLYYKGTLAAGATQTLIYLENDDLMSSGE